jgi:small-conductance mechanosensitive channel
VAAATSEATSASSANQIAASVFDALDSLLTERVPYFAEYPALQAAAVIVVAAIAAKLLSLILHWTALRWARDTRTELDDRLLDALSPAIHLSMLALGIRLAIQGLDLQPKLLERLADALGTAFILIWLVATIRVATSALRALTANERRSRLLTSHTIPLFDNLSKVVLVLIAAYLVLKTWGGDVSGLLAAGGIVGIAIGFAARDTLANLFAGIFIIADAPYKIGDFVTLDTGERGMVTQIGIRSTRMLTRDDVEITIPNSLMGNSKIVNESGGPYAKYRLRLPVGVAYGSDIDQVRDALLAVAQAEPLVCSEPEARVRLRTFGASSLDLELLCWVEQPVLRGQAVDLLLTAIYKSFARTGIEIPYAKRDVYIKQLPEQAPACLASAPDQHQNALNQEGAPKDAPIGDQGEGEGRGLASPDYS